MATSFVDLDVRPILRAGGEPFEEIMAAVATLRPGQGLRLLATFRPAPLFAVLGAKGFSHEEHELDGGEWEVLFRPPADAAASGGDDGAAGRVAGPGNGGVWPAPVREMDNRELEPPEPMQRILAATEEMRRGDVLSALLCREPIFLIPELERRGHAWRGGFDPDGTTYRILVRVGAS